MGFTIFIIIALSIDTFFLSKKRAHSQHSIRMAFYWSLLWISCALIFNLLLWLYLRYTEPSAFANEVALNFLTGYLIEKTLSVDNLFAFYLIFDQLKIPSTHQHRVFSYGIWSAIVFRLVIILLGTWLITHFHWLLYIMGLFLLFTGIKMFFVTTDDKKDLHKSRVFLWMQRHLRLTGTMEGEHFFVKKAIANPKSSSLPPKFKIYATPLFIALIFIEISDLIFAADSIPAIFAITTDPFIVWTSNIFAILGLRALYFVLANMVSRFHLLKYGIALILSFIGFKMVIEPWLVIPVGFSLGMVLGILFFFIILSLKVRSR